MNSVRLHVIDSTGIERLFFSHWIQTNKTDIVRVRLLTSYMSTTIAISRTLHHISTFGGPHISYGRGRIAIARVFGQCSTVRLVYHRPSTRACTWDEQRIMGLPLFQNCILVSFMSWGWEEKGEAKGAREGLLYVSMIII